MHTGKDTTEGTGQVHHSQMEALRVVRAQPRDWETIYLVYRQTLECRDSPVPVAASVDSLLRLKMATLMQSTVETDHCRHLRLREPTPCSG